MPKMPGKDQLGFQNVSARRDIITDTGAGLMAGSLKRAGDTLASIGGQIKSDADDLDLIRADAHWKKASLTSAEAIEQDPDHTARPTRWGQESSLILEDAASMIKDPKVREKFKLQKSVDQNSVAERFKSKSVEADKDKKLTDLRTYLDETQNRAIDPKRDNNARLQDYADLDAYIQYAEKKGLLNPEQARAFRNDYVKGTAVRLAKTMADTDPETLGKYLESLPAYQPQVDLGEVSAKYESGGRGVGFISSGKDDPGGMSYGVHQLSGEYSMGAFLKAPESGPYRDAFKGLRPQTAEFNRVYKELAAKDPDGFAKAQKDFYTRTHYEPVKAAAEKAGFSVSNRGVQEALFSMGVQHAKAAEVVAEAARRLGKDKSDPKKQIEALYEARYDYVKGLSSLPENTKQSVLNRYTREFKDSLKFADIEDGAPAGDGRTRVADAGAKLPGGTATDATPGAPAAQEAPEDAERRTLAIKLFGALDPEQRASLIKAAKARSNEKKQSQYWNDTQAAEGAIKMLEDRGELPEGFDWDATVSRIGDVQASRANGLSVEYKQAKAINQASQSSDGRPLIHMGNTDLEAHVAKLAKDRRDEKDPANFEIRDTVFRKVGERASKILKLREEDPAKAVDGDPLTGTAGHPFVEAARKQATAVEQVTDPSGGIVEQPVMSEIEGNRLIVQARLKAQEDLGISPDLRTPITEGEARAILNMPDPEGLPIEDYTRRLEEASANAEKAYGSDVAPDVMKAAIKFHIKDKNLKAIAPGVVSNILSGRPVEPGDLRKLRDAQKLSEFDRLMSGAKPEQGPGMAGPYQSPTFSRGQQTKGRPPTQEDIDNLRRFPQSSRKFDETFGLGEAAKALKEPVKSEPPAAR